MATISGSRNNSIVTEQEAQAVVSLFSQEVYSDAFYWSIYKVGSKQRTRLKEPEAHQLSS